MNRKNPMYDEYFAYLCGEIGAHEFNGYLGYYNLLSNLYYSTYKYTYSMDKNRLHDGLDLRYRYYRTPSHERLYDISCNMLEMLIALSNRMSGVVVEVTPEDWFWRMINNMKLGTMTDDSYDSKKVDIIIEKLINHAYKANGEGGLFTINDPSKDMRRVEIWTQAGWYVNSLLNM